MKYIFLVNIFSFKEDINKLRNNIKEYCKKEKVSYEIEINSEFNSVEDILKKYKKTRNVIFSIGGDGTLNRIINELVKTDNVIGVIPYGTGNDFYKTMKEQFKKGINKCDLIKINNKYFINTACFGIDADIAYNKEHITSKLIPRSQKYNYSIIKTFFSFRPRYFEININDQVIKDKFATVIVSNGRYYGNGFNIGVKSELNNDLFDVYLVKDVNRLALINVILKIKKGKHENDKNIIKFTTNKFNLKINEEVKANIDGEVLNGNEFNIEVLDKKLEVFYDEKLIKNIRKI